MQALIEEPLRGGAQASLIVRPELRIDRDTTIVLDARKAVPVQIKTPQPATQQEIFSYHTYRAVGSRRISNGVMHFPDVRTLNVTPTQRVAHGRFEFSSRWQLTAPRITARVAAPTSLAVETYPMNRMPELDGRRSWQLVYVGTASPEDLAGRDLRGKAVLRSEE